MAGRIVQYEKATWRRESSPLGVQSASHSPPTRTFIHALFWLKCFTGNSPTPRDHAVAAALPMTAVEFQMSFELTQELRVRRAFEL